MLALAAYYDYEIWQMVGVHSIGSTPEQAELEGWSFELNARSALGAEGVLD